MRFTVKWVVRGKEAEPLESERFSVRNVETLATACRYRIALMRLKFAETPPNGFVIFDDAGKEVHRWLE